MQSSESLLCVRDTANGISFVWIESYNLRTLSGFTAKRTHEETLHLPRACLRQLLWKLFGICGGVECCQHCATGSLMMTVAARRIVIRDDDVRTQQTNLQYHPSQHFSFTPGAKSFFSRF
jgi:hypothetical protein